MFKFIALLWLCLPALVLADTYDSRTSRLTISSVQVGETVYKNVVVSVESIVGTSANVTTPLTDAVSFADTYDAATRRLTIPMIEYGGKVYTNVVVTVGSVISIGSSAPAPAASGRYLVVFASNMQSSSGGCTRDSPSGCDLFMARFDADGRTVSGLTRLTSYSDAAEMFPALSPDANWVAYDYAPNSGHDVHDIRLINLQSKAEVTLQSNARFPEWVDNTHLLVSRNTAGAKDIALLELDLSGSTPKVLSTKVLCSRTACAGTSQTSDAFPFPGGTRYAFQSLDSGGTTAGLSTINADGTGFAMQSPWDGSGHVIVDSKGSRLIYTTAASGAAQSLDLASGARTTMALPATGAAIAGYDSRFASTVTINWLYAAWMQPDQAILFSAQGADAAKSFKLSRLLLAEFDATLKTPVLFDLASAIEAAAGVSGKDFCTAAAAPIRGPLLGFLGTARDDFSAARTLGATTVHLEVPATSADLSTALAAASAVKAKVIVNIDKSKIQTSALKFDLVKLAALIKPLKDTLASPSVSALLLAADICHVDTVTRQKKWDITAAELSTAIGTVKALVPGLPIAIDFSKASCLDSNVADAAAGSTIGDIAILNFWYYKWSTTPGLLDSYAVSARAFKTFASSARVQVVPKILVTETVGAEASAFPSNSWISDNTASFLAAGSAFDGVLYYDFRQQLPTETKTVSDALTDASFVAALRSALKTANTAYVR